MYSEMMLKLKNPLFILEIIQACSLYLYIQGIKAIPIYLIYII